MSFFESMRQLWAKLSGRAGASPVASRGDGGASPGEAGAMSSDLGATSTEANVNGAFVERRANAASSASAAAGFSAASPHGAVAPSAVGRPAPSAAAGRPAPTPSEAQIQAALQAFSAKDFVTADRLAEESAAHLAAGPETSETLAVRSNLTAIRGAAAIHRGEKDAAKQLFHASLDLARRSERDDAIGAALLNLVDSSFRRGALDEIPEILPEAIARTRTSPLGDFLGKVLLEAGIMRVREGKLPDSVVLFDHVCEFRPNWPTPFYQRGWTRFLQGDGGGALEDYREAARRAPVFFTVQREIRCLEDVASGELPFEVYRAFCVIREEAGRKPAETLAAATRIAERVPRFAPAHLLRAQTLRVQGMDEPAREAIRAALEHDPDPDTASAALFLEWDLARRANDEAGTLAARDRLLEGYPDHPPARILATIPAGQDTPIAVRWTYTLDGTLRFDASPAASS